VMVSVYARSPALAHTAAMMMAPLNEVGAPEAPLPAALADTGFDRLPLAGQVPPGVSVPRVGAPGASVPGVSVPGVSVPGVSVPGVSVPRASVPRASGQ
jgi:hypothetical protein